MKICLKGIHFSTTFQSIWYTKLTQKLDQSTAVLEEMKAEVYCYPFQHREHIILYLKIATTRNIMTAYDPSYMGLFPHCQGQFSTLLMTRYPFHQRSRSLWLKSCENPFCGDSDSCDAIRSQFCTGHDSSVVVTCAKLWPDSIIIFKVKTTGFFFQDLDYELKNPCGMVLDPGYCWAPFGKHALCLWNIWSS